MDFGLAVDTDISFSEKAGTIHKLSNEMSSFFESKEYGTDIKSLTIGVIVKSPQFDAFYKERRPKYYQGKNSIINDGIKIEVENALEYSIKLNYLELEHADEKAIYKIVSLDVLQSLEKIRSLERIKDFDIESFKDDLEFFFKSKSL